MTNNFVIQFSWKNMQPSKNKAVFGMKYDKDVTMLLPYFLFFFYDRLPVLLDS